MMIEDPRVQAAFDKWQERIKSCIGYEEAFVAGWLACADRIREEIWWVTVMVQPHD